MTDAQHDVEKTLRAHVRHDPQYKAFREKTTKLTVLGLRRPAMQEIEQRGFSFYVDDPVAMLKRWTLVWTRSNVHEALSLPLFYYRRHRERLDAQHWRTLKTWIGRVENWEHADVLCALYSILYERFPALVEPTLRQWNRSTNPWKRRASVVSTIYYASSTRTPPSRQTVLSLVEPLLRDPDPYVQKGVGWQLRETYELWPLETLAFLEKHLLHLSATSFSYATEKLPANTKTLLKHRRSEHRRS